MKKCCVDALTRIQDEDGMGKCLTFLLKASPYIILIPSLGSGVLNDGVRKAATRQIIEMSIATAVQKVTAAGKLPSVTDAVKAVGGIIYLKILGEIQIETTLHPVGAESAFWNKLLNLYEAKGGVPVPEPGWFSGWW